MFGSVLFLLPTSYLSLIFMHMYTTHTHTHTTVGDHRGAPGGARGDAEEDAGLDEEEPASGGPQ